MWIFRVGGGWKEGWDREVKRKLQQLQLIKRDAVALDNKSGKNR
jgi:hypothetical protein